MEPIIVNPVKIIYLVFIVTAFFSFVTMELVISNPKVPFVQLIPGGFMPGKFIRIQGSTTSSADSIGINLQVAAERYSDDIALHLAIRFPEGVIVRDSFEQGGWKSQERDGGLPITRGATFEILIGADPLQFKIAINGRHFCNFRHRISINRVSYFGVVGDVSITQVSFEGYPDNSDKDNSEVNHWARIIRGGHFGGSELSGSQRYALAVAWYNVPSDLKYRIVSNNPYNQ